MKNGLDFRSVYCSECGAKIYFYAFLGEHGKQMMGRFCRSCKNENWAFVQSGKFQFYGALPF